MHLSLVQTLYREIGSFKFAQISIHGPIRRCKKRSSLEARPGRCAFCTYSRFAFLGSTSPSLPFLMHLCLVQTLCREIGSSEFAQIYIPCPTRRCRMRSSLEARPGRCAFCTNKSCTFVGSASSLLPFDMHYSLVQSLYRTIGSSEFAQISIHGPIGAAGDGAVWMPVPVGALFAPPLGLHF